MASDYNNYTFSVENGEVVRKPKNMASVTTRPINAYQTLNSVWYTDSYGYWDAEQLIHSGLLTSGLDFYMIGRGIREGTASSGLTQSIKQYCNNAPIMQYASDSTMRIYNSPYQVAGGYTRRLRDYYCDNLVEVKFNANTGSTASWENWYFKCTYTTYTGLLTASPGTQSECYPAPSSPTYQYPSGIDLEWRWTSTLPINNGIVLSGKLTGYGDKYLHYSSGDYLPPTSGILPYMFRTTHGDVPAGWTANYLDTYSATVSGYVIGNNIALHQEMMDGTMPNYENPLDFFMLDGPTTFYVQSNRNNPSGLVPSQIHQDDPLFYSVAVEDYVKYIGYIDLNGDYDPYDVDSTTLHGSLVRISDRSELERAYEDINAKLRKDTFNQNFPNKMFYNGVDVDSVNTHPAYVSGVGNTMFRDRNDFIYDESPFRHLAGWDNWWDWRHEFNDLWYYVQRYGPKNRPHYVFFDYMSTDDNTTAPYQSHKHYMGYYGQAICLLTDSIYSAGRHTASVENGTDNSLNGAAYGGEADLAQRGFFRKYEIGDPINDPYLTGNTIRRDFTNGYVEMLNSGIILHNPEKVFEAARIKTYQLREYDIPSLWGAWISDENFFLSNVMYSGMAPIKRWEPERGDSAPTFSGVGGQETPYMEFADVGCWYPSINFQGTPTGSGVLSAGPQTIDWPELTVYVYGYFDGSQTTSSKLVSHYRENGVASFTLGYSYSSAIFKNAEFEVFTDYDSNGNQVGQIQEGLNGWKLFTGQYKWNDQRLYIDGQLSASTTNVSGNLTGTFASDYALSVGGVVANGTVTEKCNGKLAALIICSGFHDETTRATIESGLLARYSRQF